MQQALANPDRALHTLVDGAPAAVGADWAALLEFGPDGGQSGVLAVSLGGPAPEAVAVRAPLRLATVRLGARSGGEAPPAALVPLGPTLGLVLVREGGVGFHGSELWRLGALGSIVGEAVRGRTPPEAATTPR